MGMFMFGMISIYQLERMLDQGSPLLLVDLRTEEEYIYGHLYTAVNIPYESLADREEELYKGLPVLFYCEHGGRVCRRPGNMPGVALKRQAWAAESSITAGNIWFRDKSSLTDIR